MRGHLGDEACVPQSGLHMRREYVLTLAAFPRLQTIASGSPSARLCQREIFGWGAWPCLIDHSRQAIALD